MDNDTPKPTESASNNQVEPVGQPVAPAAGFSSGMRVIQPLDPNLKVDNTPPQPPAQPASISPQGQTLNPAAAQSTDTTQPPQPIANSSSIYPEATQGVSATSYQTPNPTNDKKDTSEATTFSDGYSIGGTIFWYQLIAGIVFGLIFYGLTVSVLKTTSTSLISIVGLLHYVIEYLVLIYVPYSVLKSNAVEEPFWLTLFGVAAQSVIVAAAFELVDLIIVKSIINHGVSSSLTHIGGSGLAATAIIVYIGFLIASYFLTKLSWGVAFSLFGKITNKVVVKAVGVAVIAIIVGGIAYHYLTLPSSKVGTNQSNALTTSQSSSLSNYNVNGNPSYSVDFYKGSVVTTVAGQTILLHAEKSGEQAYILVSTATSPTTSCAFATMPTFTFSTQGTQGLGCYQANGSDGYVQVNGQNYVIKIISDNSDQTLQANKAIFNSIVIN